jgi:hypothetical protein
MEHLYGCPWPGCEKSFETQRGLKLHRKKNNHFSDTVSRFSFGFIYEFFAVQQLYLFLDLLLIGSELLNVNLSTVRFMHFVFEFSSNLNKGHECA